MNLEDIILELQRCGWFVSDLYHSTDNKFDLQLYNAHMDKEFENCHNSIKEAFQEAYDVLILRGNS